MSDVHMKDFDVITGQAAGSMPGGDFIGQLNKLAAEANKFMDGLKQLSEKSGLPLIGQDGAISRFAVPTAAPIRQAPPLPLPVQPRQTAPPAAMPAVDWPAVLDRIDAEIQKRGLSNITIGMIFEVYRDKPLRELLKEIKGNGTNTKG